MFPFGIPVVAAAAMFGQPEPPVDVAALEKAVLDYRRAIQRGQMMFTESGFKGETRHERKTAIWFDGGRIRNDSTFRYKGDQAPPHREVQCRNCECDGCYVFYSDYKADNVPIALSLHRMRAENNPDAYMALDARLLGLVVDSSPNLAASRSRLDSFVGAPNRSDVAIHPDSWKGKNCQRIDYTHAQGAKIRIWIVSEWGPSVGRIELENDVRGHHYLEYVESDCKPSGATGVWFPQTCVYEQLMDGKPLEKDETSVQVVSLNEPLSADVFRLAGMDVPVGWPVDGFRQEGLSYWNGKEIVPHDPPSLKAVASANGVSREVPASSWPYVVGAIVFALLGATAVWWYFAQKRAGR